MKFLFLFLSILSFNFSHAITITVYSENGTREFSRTLSNHFIGKDTKTASKAALRNTKLWLAGSTDYLSVINGIGPKNIQLSESELRAYGWCYSINGVSPEESAKASILENASDELVWFYGYVTRLNGVWVPGCKSDHPEMNLALNRLKLNHQSCNEVME